jgi:hypothetical protein
MLVAISDLGVEAFTVLPCPDIAVTEMQEYKAVLGIEILPEMSCLEKELLYRIA